MIAIKNRENVQVPSVEEAPAPTAARGSFSKPWGTRDFGPLQSREEMRGLILRLWQPLRVFNSISNARCYPGATGVSYGHAAAGLEGTCRPLWPVVACAAGGQSLQGMELLRGAMSAGANSSDRDFWGEFTDADQRCVETAVLGWALAVAPGLFWDQFDETERERFAAWLGQINHVEDMPPNNWRFFRVLINLGLRAVGRAHSGERLEEDLSVIEGCYLGDGWYSDGRGTQRDYYVAMAMHFYGLLVAAQNPADLAEYTGRYRERARLFAPRFMHWFVPDGSALPYGRSLTYRFAQGAFWAALCWANEEALAWGVIKGLLLRHLRWWLREPIFDSAGVLTIGYKYPNLNIAEGYNSPASPYWAMKALLPAGLLEDHPFWRAEEQPLPDLADECAQSQPGFIIRRHDDRQHITVLASGQFPEGWNARHAAEKYAKFAYSTRFGFSVPVGRVTLEDGAHDNMLALSDDGRHWRTREKCDEARLENGMLLSTWSVWPDVRVHTWLFFDGEWQVRAHRLESGRRLFSAEAGHSVPRPDLERAAEKACWHGGPGRAFVIFPENAAGLFDPIGSRMGAVVVASPNSNVLHPRTVLPTLRGEHPAGGEWLVSFLPVSYDPAAFPDSPGPAVEIDARHRRITLSLPSGRELALSPALDISVC